MQPFGTRVSGIATPRCVATGSAGKIAKDEVTQSMDAADKIAVVENTWPRLPPQTWTLSGEIYADNARVEDPIGTLVHDG